MIIKVIATIIADITIITITNKQEKQYDRRILQPRKN